MIHKQRWTAVKIQQRLELIQPLVYRQKADIPPFRYHQLNGPTDLEAQTAVHTADYADWPTIEPQTYWGSWTTDFVMRTSFTIPNDWERAQPIALFLPIGEAGDFSHPEALVYVNGRSLAACDRHHQEILLPADLGSGLHDLALRGWTGLGGWLRKDLATKLYMRACQIVQIDQPTRDFLATARTTLGIANNIDDNHPAKGHLLNGLDAACKLLDIREPVGDDFYDTVPAAHQALQAHIALAGPALDVNVFTIGHAHIDVAWLWTLGQTRRKAERSFHTVLHLMEQFPEYKFTQSQPQLYDYIRQDSPELFAAIQEQVRNGRWEAIGGMWVEADCNLSGGESLARQFLLGRNFFREHFGAEAESPILWLPDVFGYAWNLPQLIKEAGLEYFFTIKIGWSQYNRVPFDSFWWQGLDGTRVLTHFSTSREGNDQYASTYNAKASAYEALSTWSNFQQKEQSQDLLMAFGYGDGGGGPTREMLENIREMSDFPATPHLHHAKAIDFFRALEANAGDQLPTWNGELYLELHRGTYTTQARNKRANRKSEFLLHNAEFIATFASVISKWARFISAAHPPSPQPSPSREREPIPSPLQGEGQGGGNSITHLKRTLRDFDYPHEALRHAWQLVCLNQFHDIIPGSSITAVYEESLAQYAEVRELAEGIIDQGLTAVANTLQSDILYVNPNPFPLREIALLPKSIPIEPSFANQQVENGTLVHIGAIEPYTITDRDGFGFVLHDLDISPAHLENDFLRVEFNQDGDITRIFDKENEREVLPKGAVANQFLAFEDRPQNWDAWDIDIFYDDKVWLAEPAESIKVVEDGPLRATVEIKRRILNSTVRQRISLRHFSRRLDFNTTVDWQEKHILLKAAFPVDVLTPAASYEVQWGHVQRPFHRNTSWDWARFETAAQKWVDVSENDYGVSLLNDCKYGHDIQDNAPHGAVMRLSLLRSTTHPDPHADEGIHHFCYSLLPHNGRLSIETIREAYALNNPPFVFQRGGAEAQRKQAAKEESFILHPSSFILPPSSLILCDHENVVIETIKQAEDGNGIIVRLYESLRQRGMITLQTGLPLAAGFRTNLLEENQEELVVEGDRVMVKIRPFQIITLRLTFGENDD